MISRQETRTNRVLSLLYLHTYVYIIVERYCRQKTRIWANFRVNCQWSMKSCHKAKATTTLQLLVFWMLTSICYTFGNLPLLILCLRSLKYIKTTLTADPSIFRFVNGRRQIESRSLIQLLLNYYMLCFNRELSNKLSNRKRRHRGPGKVWSWSSWWIRYWSTDSPPQVKMKKTSQALQKFLVSWLVPIVQWSLMAKGACGRILAAKSQIGSTSPWSLCLDLQRFKVSKISNKIWMIFQTD